MLLAHADKKKQRLYMETANVTIMFPKWRQMKIYE